MYRMNQRKMVPNMWNGKHYYLIIKGYFKFFAILTKQSKQTCRHLEILFWARVNLLRWQVCVPIDSHDVSCVFSNLSSARNFYRNLAIRICTACLRCECAYASPDGPNIERGLIKQVYENNATTRAPELNKANTYKSRARHKQLNWPDSLLYLFNQHDWIGRNIRNE